MVQIVPGVGEAATKAGKEEVQQQLTKHTEAQAEALGLLIGHVDGYHASLTQLRADLQKATAGSVEAGEARLRAAIALASRKLGMVMDDYTQALEARLLKQFDDRVGTLAAELRGSHEHIMARRSRPSGLSYR